MINKMPEISKDVPGISFERKIAIEADRRKMLKLMSQKAGNNFFQPKCRKCQEKSLTLYIKKLFEPQIYGRHQSD